MREIPLSAMKRTGVGKGFARRTRMEGRIPAVVYGPEVDPVPVAVEEQAFRAAMKKATTSTIFKLQIEGEENQVLVREIQRHPVTNRVTHVDFHAISMTKPINVTMPLTFVGTPVGVKVDGGIMQTTMRELSIYCLPKDIPDDFEIDVAELGIGDSIHVRDLEIPNVEILDPERRTVVVISAPTVIKAADEEAEEGEEGEEGAEEGAEGEGEAAEGGEASADEATKE